VTKQAWFKFDAFIAPESQTVSELIQMEEAFKPTQNSFGIFQPQTKLNAY
jgi:hypothetical protein